MRLIDADALLETSSGVTMIIPTNIHPHEAVKIQGNAFREAVEKAPTVDALEVVRCKDCRFYVSATLQCDHEFWMDVEGWPANAEQDGFCHKGERRNDG